MWVNDSLLLDCGIDWFTTTATDKDHAQQILIAADGLMVREHAAGFEVRGWRMSGYSGSRCGRVEAGVRDDGAIVRLSSGLADSEWWRFWQITGRCTRIDLQATYRAAGNPNDELSRMSEIVREHYAERRDGPEVTDWSNTSGGRTVYLGKRQSNLYFRAYNKHAQSGLPEYEGCFRLELEVKGGVCASVIGALLAADSIKAGVLGCLARYLGDSGISTSIAFTLPLSFYEGPVLVSDAVRTLLWFESAVRPSIERLIERGLVQQAIDSLGLRRIFDESKRDCDNL